MQQYEQFWHNKLSHLDSQLLVDFDTFMNVFCQQIYARTSIILTDLQKQCIKAEIDPQNQNQVYKNGYLLFVKNFWGVASNRTKLFNMKLNLTKLKGQVDTLPMAGSVKITIAYPYELHQQNADDGLTKGRCIKIQDKYLLKNDILTLIQSIPASAPNPSLHKLNIKHELQYKGFVTIGSQQKCNIVIPSTSVNQTHLKLIYATNLQTQGKSTHSFKVEPKAVNNVFIRDISSSNPCQYVIDNEHKYVVAKAGMILRGLGMIDGMFEIIIDVVPNVMPNDVINVMDNLNADRKSFMVGQPDKPLKVAVNFEMGSINPSLIADLYDRNLYYPELSTVKGKTTGMLNKQEQQKTKPSLKFRVINRRTLQEQKYDSKILKQMIIGRDLQRCSVVIDHISIRPIQFSFECINEIWFIRPHNGVGESKLNKNISVLLSKHVGQNSNRIGMGAQYPEHFTIKGGIHIAIQVTDREHQPQDQ